MIYIYPHQQFHPEFQHVHIEKNQIQIEILKFKVKLLICHKTIRGIIFLFHTILSRHHIIFTLSKFHPKTLTYKISKTIIYNL